MTGSTPATATLPAGHSGAAARHPLVAAWVVSGTAQLAGLLLHHFGRDPQGHPLFSSPLNTLMIAVPLLVAWQTVFAAASAALWKLLPPLRAATTAVAMAVAALLVLLGQVDCGLQRFRGERLSLPHFSAYGHGGVLNSDVVRPVFADPLYPLFALGLVAVAWGAIAWLGWRAWRGRAAHVMHRGRPTWRGIGRALALAAACYAPLGFAYYHQRDMGQPPAVRLARAWLYPTEPMSAEKEAAHRAELRRFLDPEGTSRWLSDAHPLVRVPAARAAGGGPTAVPADPPDIVIFCVESLRGADVGWGLRPRPAGQSATPRLDALAARSVTFPRYIANGDPTPRGFITLNAGVWEHRWGFILANFPNLASDSLPGRLRERHGYRTMALWGGDPSFDNQLVWARRRYDELDFELPGNRLFYFRTRPDRTVIDNFVARVRAHDAREPGRPLFAYVATNGTHTPFTPEDGTPVGPGETVQQRYDRCLRHVDAQIARAVEFLETRARARNTVVIVVGDHADKTTEAFDERWRGLPTDPLVWTAALVHGPERLVGAPRREEFAASHVDLLPTVMAWLGDDGPWAGFGQDLFAPVPAARRTAVAVNSRGYRLDRAGFTLIVDAADPRTYFAYPWFPDGPPAPVPLERTPFAADEPQRLAERMVYWSYLIEENRAWPGTAGGR